LRQRFQLPQHGRCESLETVRDDEREPAVAGLVPQEYFENMPQFARRTFDGAGTNLLEKLRQQLLAGFAARLDPRER
jgi:hypothetical protein